MKRSPMSDTMPLAVLSSIAHAVDMVRVWKAAITQARAMEVVAHQPGRYEDDRVCFFRNDAELEKNQRIMAHCT